MQTAIQTKEKIDYIKSLVKEDMLIATDTGMVEFMRTMDFLKYVIEFLDLSQDELMYQVANRISCAQSFVEKYLPSVPEEREMIIDALDSIGGHIKAKNNNCSFDYYYDNQPLQSTDPDLYPSD